MKRKFEDKVALLAFGDLSPEETARLEREVHQNPEALHALALYKDMREGLRSLSDIPEDQFSKERLRDAILTQGLRPVATRPVSNRTWLWMPTAACLIGFGLMFTMNSRHRSAGPPNIVINTPKNYQFGSAITPPTPVAIADSKVTKGPFGRLSTSASYESHVAQRVDPDEVDPRIITNNLENGFEDTSYYDPDLGSVPTTAKQPAGKPVGGNVALNEPSTPVGSTTGPIVLIDQEKDDQTGACKATEVGSASNVLVGG